MRPALVAVLGILVSGCASAPCSSLSTTSAVAAHVHAAVFALALFADVAGCIATGEEVARPPSFADLERDAAIHRDPVGAASDLLRDLDTWSDAGRRRPTQ